MNNMSFTIMVFAVVGITLLCVAVGALVYEAASKKSAILKPKSNDWLFADFHETIFHLCYKEKAYEKICGIDVDEYERFCGILHKETNIKRMVALRVEGIVIFMVCALLAYVSSYNLIILGCFMAIGFISLYLLCILPYKKLKNDAEERLFHIKDDLPRFLSLLEKAMDFPIGQAILVTASKFDSPLADDMMDCINRVALGADGWQNTLVDLAKLYDIEVFSDLVLDIVNSFEQGVNIRPLVERKAYEIEQTRLYDVEAHDAKVKSLIFFPIIALKLLPLMVLICLPMLASGLTS